MAEPDEDQQDQAELVVSLHGPEVTIDDAVEVGVATKALLAAQHHVQALRINGPPADLLAKYQT